MTPRIGTLCIAIVLATWALGAVGLGAIEIARADAAAEARFWDALARQAYARGRYGEALGHFLASHDSAPAPRTLYNVALCASLSGDDALAYVSFADYLASGEAHESRREDAARRSAALARRLALIRVESDPPGATIWVDRRDLGAYGATPRTLVLPPGSHTIELEADGRRGARVETVAVVGELRDVRATLEPRTGRLRIDAPGAHVTLERDGETLSIASGREETVPIGAWRARVTAPGMRDATMSIAVTEDRVEARRVELEAQPIPTGRLLIRTADVAARVAIDGEPRAETPVRLDVPAGAHEIAIEAAGHVRWARRVEIAAGATLRLDVTLIAQ